jgi:hypothetical protein
VVPGLVRNVLKQYRCTISNIIQSGKAFFESKYMGRVIRLACRTLYDACRIWQYSADQSREPGRVHMLTTYQ